jgi:hypothetical protein
MIRTLTRIAALLAAVVLTAAVPAAADHYPSVPRGAQKRDRQTLDGLRRLTYAWTDYITLAPVSCDCLELTCGDGQLMTSCGGEIYPIGILTAARRTSRETCLVCGCAGDAAADLAASPVCIGF